MTIGALAGVVAALGFVLVLLGLAFRMLGRFAGFRAAAAGRLPMEVVGRLSLGPRQGLAAVRIGDRLVVLSVGDGGVRNVVEVQGGELAAPAAAHGSAAAEPAVSFARMLRTGRGGAAASCLAAVLLGASVLPARAETPAGPGAAAAAAASPVPAPAQQAGAPATPQVGLPAGPRLDLRLGNGQGSDLRLNGTVGTVVMMGFLAVLPTLLLLMTSFSRIVIVLHFMRQAIGAQSAPPGHLVAALALLLTFFTMAPTISEVNAAAIRPWLSGEMDESAMLKAGVQPFREFMLEHTGEQEVVAFQEMSGAPPAASAEDVSLVVLVSAFATSELRAAFQIGFALFLPFVVIDLVVASVLASMGMFMLPPAMISLPCKLLLFVLVDGWSLIVQSLVASFR